MTPEGFQILMNMLLKHEKKFNDRLSILDGF